MMSAEISLYDIYLEAATRLFTNMQFLSSAVGDEIRTNMERNPQLFGDKSKQYMMQMERDHAQHIVNLYKEISKNNISNVVQVVLLFKPDTLTRTQFANYVASASALPLVKADTDDLTKWYDLGMPKGFFEVKDPNFFLKVEKYCIDSNIAQHIIDLGNNEIKAMGIGPAKVDVITKITGNLKRL